MLLCACMQQTQACIRNLCNGGHASDNQSEYVMPNYAPGQYRNWIENIHCLENPNQSRFEIKLGFNPETDNLTWRQSEKAGSITP